MTLHSYEPVELPDWLAQSSDASAGPAAPVPVDRRRTLKALQELQFESLFPSLLDQLSNGRPFTSIVQDDQRDINAGQLLRWIKKDPERFNQFNEALEICSYVWSGEIISIADGLGGSLIPEEIERSKLRIEARKYNMAAHNRKVYGNIKQLEVGGTVSIVAALREANARARQVIDAESVVLPQIGHDNE